jgi:hypothetical protein
MYKDFRVAFHCNFSLNCGQMQYVRGKAAIGLGSG